MKVSNNAGGSQPAVVPARSVEPIAIVGFGFKFPQDITNAESLWKLLIERRSTMTEIPKNRWNIDGFYKENGHRPGTVKNRGGHFLADDPARFDAPFFSIQPAEAECMDPQQRLLLETSYHALENAGIPMQAAVGTRTSVHVGCLLQEYNQITQRDSQMPGDYRIVGSSGLAMLSNRLSWFYDFSGPSMTIDTACSGGLVALHLACQELLAGSVNMSLVCGSNLCLLPDSTALLSSLNMMSKDSVCYSFDERASGYARGEGFGVLVLKRLSEAIADGNNIRGVIRSTGCGQDGNTPSITSPSQAAQERLIRETYARAGLSLDETRYFEAHGTGTPVGDPCEAAAINSVFSARTTEKPMYVGAIKANMGHPEGASGIAGVIKTLLVLEKGIIPPNVYPERISATVAAAGPNLKFPLEPTMWPTSGLRRASVNSFGYGGTNAHVVIDDALNFLRQHGLEGRHCTEDVHRIDEAKQDDYCQTSTLSESTNGDRSDIVPSDHTPSGSADDLEPHNFTSEDNKPASKLLVVSAFDERAVYRSIDALQKWILGHLNNDDRDRLLHDFAYTLAEKRTKFPWKTVCVAPSDPRVELAWSPPVRSKQKLNICFVFTGQGAQWHGMGRELMRYEIFSKVMREADGYFRSLGSSWSLLNELHTKPEHESAIHKPELSQPICTALQVALLDLLTSWNVRASISVGHSSGEIAAAYASRAISRESAWMVAYFRGLAVGITQMLSPSNGAMVAVQAPLNSWKHLLDKHNDASPDEPIAIACYNSLHSFTLSGPRAAILQLVSSLKEANIEVHVLRIDVAYHSPYMKPVAEIYHKLLRQIEPGDPLDDCSPSFVSTVTGKALENDADLRTAEYWNSNLTGSVRFSVALEGICARPDASSYCFMEIGPHSVLRSPLSDILKAVDRDIASDYTSVLRRGHAADITAMQCVGKLYTLGAPVDLSAINKNVDHDTATELRLLTSLPSYPFEDKKRYWLEGRTSIQYRQTQYVHHELLGSRTPDWNEHEARWTNRILLDQSPYLKDHQINGLCLMPAAGMVVMAIEAVRQFYGDVAVSASGYKMRDVSFTKAMTLSEDPRGTEMQLTLRPGSGDSRDMKPGSAWNLFSLYVYENDAWHLCCSGDISVTYDETGGGSVGEEQSEKARNIFSAVEQCRTEISSTDVYSAFDKAGLCYGPTFRGMRVVKWDEQSQQAVASIGLREWQKHAKYAYTDGYLVHPAALDAILQVTFPAYSIFAKSASATTVPTGFSNAWFSADLLQASDEAKNVKVHAQVMGCGFRNKLFSVGAANEEDERLYFYGELETSTIGRSGASADEGQATNVLYRIDWKPADFSVLDLEGNTMLDSANSTVYMVYDDSDDLQRDFAQALREVARLQLGLEIVSISWISVLEHNLSENTCVFLPGLNGSFLRLMQDGDLVKIKQLLSNTSRLIWPTLQHLMPDQSPTEGLVSGLVRTLATESEDYHLISVCLNGINGMGKLAMNLVKVIETKLKEQTDDPEDEYWEINGVLCTPRVIDDAELVAQVLPPSKEVATFVSKPWSELENPVLTIGAAGILNTLHFEQGPIQNSTLESDGHVLVQVKAVGLNGRDVQVALGQVHDETLGSEIAGVVLQVGSSCASRFQVGDCVFGITHNGIAQTAQSKSFQLQKIPQNMSFSQAATYPVAFCIAYYGLVQVAHVKSSDKVLIHDAASPLGQAAIQISRLQGCTYILSTVSSIEEMDCVSNTSGIPKSHLFLAGDSSLEHGIRRLTSGQGVDVIMGSTERILNSCGCIASFGRILDVGEKHTFVSTANRSKETPLPIAAITTQNVTFSNINFHELTDSYIFEELFENVCQLIGSDRIVPPGPLAMFKQSEVEQAFRVLQDEKLASKVVIEIESSEVVDMEVAPNASKPLFHKDASYLIAGAFGGIGQSIVQWMVQQGAKYLILPSRSPIEGTGSERERFIRELQAQGATVRAPICDIADKHQLQSALDSLNNIPAIRGCIQAAMVMRDASFVNMSAEKWHQSLAPKVDGSWNLHELLPDSLDFFIMLSSSTGIMGSFGQSNYTAGNTYQDALAAHRMRHGQRAHTLALSMVTGVGYVAQNEQVQALLRVRGMLEEVSMQDIFNLLHFCCDPTRVDTSSIGAQIITPLTLPADLRAMGIVAPLGSTRPIYHYLDTLPARISSTVDADKSRPSHLLAEAKSLAHATDIIVGAIQSQLSSLLVVSKEDIDSQKAIYRYGVDSLVAVEMRNWFSKAVGADVSTADIMSDISIWLLAVKVAGASRFVRDELKE